MKRILCSFFAFIFTVFFIWYAGMDFFERSLISSYALFICCLAGFGVYFYPGWED